VTLRSTSVIAMVVVGSFSSALAQSPRPPQAPPPIANADAYYRLGPDSLPQDGVPKGELKGPFTLHEYPRRSRLRGHRSE
jgi:enterochelin esterase family protein